MSLEGKPVKRTRLVRTPDFVIAVEVEGVTLDADPDEVCYEPATVELLRQVELHAKQGDLPWLVQRGKVYAAV